MIWLDKDAFAVITRESENAYPDECCGALLGHDAGESRFIKSVVPIANQFDDGEKYHRFRIEADDILRVELTARKQGVDVLGFYHSHPDHPAIPSDYDREHALPFYSYLIMSVENGKAVNLLGWELTTDRSVFEKREISNKQFSNKQ